MKKYDCLFIGNAIVDIVANASFEFLKEQNIDVGSWRPTKLDEISQLQNKMKDTLVASGGSAANSAVGFSFLGGKSSFIGRVKDDEFGQLYIKDLQDANVDFVSSAVKEGDETGRCLVYVTPDAQRSMRTYLGAASNLSPGEINDQSVEESEFIYMEGYLWDEPVAKEACKKAYNLSRKFETKSVLSLSDSFCVEKWRSEIRDLTKETDIIFGNEEEICAMIKTDSINDGINYAKSLNITTAITLAEKGSLIVNNNEVIEVPPIRVDKVIDTTGAGDLFAAGFLYGLCQNKDLASCGHMASVAAAEIISHYGARPLIKLSNLV